VEWNEKHVKFLSDVLRDHDKMKIAARGLNMYKEKKSCGLKMGHSFIIANNCI